MLLETKLLVTLGGGVIGEDSGGLPQCLTPHFLTWVSAPQVC